MLPNVIQKLRPVAAIVTLVIFISSCRFGLNDPYPIERSSNLIEEQIPLQNFDRIEMGNAFEVYVKKGSNFSIKAVGDSYDIADLEAIVNNGKLKIKYKNNVNRRFEMKFYITMPRLIEANFYSAVLADITNFSENKIRINASGASDIFVDCDAKYWDIDMSGASVIEIKGQGKSMDLEASGSSELFASNLYLDNIDLDISGTSTISVFAYNEIIGRASGASEVRFRGNPLVDIRLSGSSWVTKN
jgi:hypothetical protein